MIIIAFIATFFGGAAVGILYQTWYLLWKYPPIRSIMHNDIHKEGDCRICDKTTKKEEEALSSQFSPSLKMHPEGTCHENRCSRLDNDEYYKTHFRNSTGK